MIRELRRKFILVAMSSLLAVLLVLVLALNIVNYTRSVQRADRILELLSQNEGRFPDHIPMGDEGKAKPLRNHEDGFLSMETPFDTRFFSVQLNASGEAVSVDTGRIAAVDTKDAILYAQLLGSKKKGFHKDYRYLNYELPNGGSRVIFVDCSKELDAVRSLAGSSVLVSVLGALAVFLLVLVFSRRVFRPVEESYRKQKQFITDASHELKTPLTILSADVDILEMDGGNQWTTSIRNQVKRLQNLTEQMVILSRMDEQREGEKNVPFQETVDLSALAKDLSGGYETMAHVRGKCMELKLTQGISLKGDRDKLGQMLGLLLDNALKYSDEHGQILVELQPYVKRGKSCKLRVWNTVDEATGMQPGKQDILFERFYRPDASRNSKTGGSGIGLSVVKAIVELHHGKISARSEDGKSLEIIIIL